jgi:hypothetical protein
VESFRAGELPQWDPSYQSGVPALGNIHAAVFYPPNVLYQWLSFPRAYGWLIWLHHLTAGLGAYVLLRRLRLEVQPAIAGALAFLLSGYLVGLANAGPLMAGAAFVPWVMAVVADDRAWPWRAGLIAVLLAAQSLTGDPQSVVFSGLASLLLILVFPMSFWECPPARNPPRTSSPASHSIRSESSSYFSLSRLANTSSRRSFGLLSRFRAREHFLSR